MLQLAAYKVLNNEPGTAHPISLLLIFLLSNDKVAWLFYVIMYLVAVNDGFVLQYLKQKDTTCK